MNELKAKIINTAERLLNLLECCEDDDFIDAVVGAIYDNDVEPLWELEEELQ